MKKAFEVSARNALISPDGKYRYWLSRWFKALEGPEFLQGKVVFIMLNPSTADAKVDDATIRRCMDFAFRWGYRELMVVNLYAWRARQPAELLKAADPVGPENNRWILEACKDANIHVAAWGALRKPLRSAVDGIVKICAEAGYNLKCLGVTKDGQPRHPLMLKKRAALVDWHRTAS